VSINLITQKLLELEKMIVELFIEIGEISRELKLPLELQINLI